MEEGNNDDGQAYDDINEECILECNDDQFDVLVDNVEDMIRDVRGEEDEMTEAELRKYLQFVVDSKKNLFIPFVRSTLQLKAAHGWTDKSFKALLLLLKDMLLEGNLLPDTVNEAKQIVCPVGLKIEKNSCMLS